MCDGTHNGKHSDSVRSVAIDVHGGKVNVANYNRRHVVGLTINGTTRSTTAPSAGQ